MFVYLDESGDTGFKFRQGSSRYFVVTLLLIDDPIPMQIAIDDLRERLGFAATNECTFSSSSESVRDAFLRLMTHQECRVSARVIDKALMTRPHMRKRETFYNFLVKLILTHDGGMIRDALVILDESVKSKKSKQELTTYLRKALNTDPASPKVRGVRYHDSRSDNLIQAVDMLSGAIYAKYHRGDRTYARILRPKIADLWEWRPRETR